ncbi:polycystin-1-like protein 2 [Anabrus simplex]|uniref:polycystin-1-like protein 2 n=1 Tax=Anabrus simplex TaxID=316456 RepID=UPI0035A3840B
MVKNDTQQRGGDWDNIEEGEKYKDRSWWRGFIQITNSPNRRIDGTTWDMHCYFDIFPESLIIRMVGGEARAVGKDQDIKVDASASHDPNEADNNQHHLAFKWTCDVKPPSTEFCKGKNDVISTEKILIVPKKYLEIGQEYKFNLELSSKLVVRNPMFATKPEEMVQTVTVIKGNPPKLDIECLLNCGKFFKPNPRDVVSMKVVCSENCQGESQEKFYEWDIESSKSNEKIDWDRDTQMGRYTYRLIVRENVLSAGTTYEFKVTGGTDTKTVVSLSMTINIVPEIGECSIEPDSGYSGITEFSIECKDVQDEDDWPLRYDFFQSNDENFIGVLMYYNVEPNATGVKLMEGKSGDDYKSAINVRVTDNFGMSAEVRVSVKVKPMQQAVGEEDLMNSIKVLVESKTESGTLPTLLSGGDMSGAVRLIGSLADALVNIEAPEEAPNIKSEVTSELLTALEQVPVPTIAAVTQVASVLRKVIITDEKALKPNNAVAAATMTNSLSNQLLKMIEEDAKGTEEVRQVAKSVIDCVSTVIATFPTGRPAEDYSDINPEEVETQGNVQVASDQSLETIDKIGDALGRQIVEMQEAISVVAEKVTVWVKEDKPTTMVGHMMGAGKADTYGVKLTSDLADALEESSTYLQFQVSIIEENPFWWQKMGNDVNSHVISVSLLERKKKREAKELPKPIDLYLRVKPLDEIPIVNGSMNLTLDPEKVDEFESNIPIHRIDLKEGETVFVSFEPFEKSDIVMKDTAKTEEFFVMDYQFRVHTTRCQYWSLEDKEWSTKGCTIGPETSTSKIHCRCSHLSAFSGSLFVPPNKINPIYDVDLFLTVVDNPLIVVFVCMFLLGALLLMLWARRQDKKDILRRRVTILEDNTPGEYYAYLVTVYTGSRKGAGTTSTVGIQLIGSQSSSKEHILRSSKRKVLKTAYADWFVIFTDSRLGDLVAIKLWHNSSGHRQSWYCRDIVIRDVQTKEKWTFLLNRWISLLHGNGTASYTIPVATKKQERSFAVLFADNNDFRFRDEHLFISVFARNPRSFFTRVQRIAVITNITFMAMLGNIMFYGIPKGTPADQMEEGSFFLDIRPIMIGLETCLITVPVSFTIVFLFRKISPKPTPLLRKSIIEVLHPERNDDSVSGGKDQSDSRYTERPSTLEDIKRKWGLSRFRANLLYILPTDPVTETDYLHYTAYVSEQTESKKSKKCSCFAWCKKRKTQESDAVGASNPRYLSSRNIKNASNVGGSDRKQKVGPPYLFPWWVIYIAWFLTVTSTIIAAYFVMLYGLSYGRIKSYLWLTAMISSILTKLFIVEPIKIICISLLFTVIFKTEAKEVDMVTGAPLEIELPRNYRVEMSEEHLMKLIQMRQEREYKPIPEQWLGFLRVRARKRRQLGFMMYDLMIFLLYMIILCSGATFQRDSLTFLSSKNVANMFIEAKYWGSTKFQDIKNNVSLVDFLNHTLIPSLHEVAWYNGNETGEEGWTADLSTKLLGVARLRQLRVRNDSCYPASRINKLIKHCWAPFSKSAQDIQNYAIKWKSPNKIEYSSRATSPWIYQSSYDTDSWPITGEFAFYPGGGYVSNLGKTRENSKKVLQFLVDYGWLDSLTRAVIVEFTLYNANRNLFNVVTLLIEVDAAGTCATSHNIKTASLLYIHSTNYRVQLVLFVLFVVMVSVLFLRQMMVMRELSVRVFCSKFWNLLDVFIVFVGIVCIAVVFARNFHVRSLLTRLAITDDNEFISFYGACFIDEILSYTIGFLICLSTVRLWRLLHFGQNFKLFEVTLFLARHSLLSLTLMFVLILAAFSCLVYLVMGNILQGFRSLSRSFTMLISLSIDLNKDFEYSVFFESNRVLGPIIFLSFCIVCAIFVINMFVTVMLTYYTAAQEHIFRNNITYNLYHYMRDEFYHYFRKSIVQGRTDTIRLRGGADKDDISDGYETPRSSEAYHAARSSLDVDKQAKKSSRSSVGSKKSSKSLERRSSASLDRKGSSARSVGRKKSLKQVNSKGKKPKTGSKSQLEDTEDTAAPPIKKTLGRKKSSARSLKPSRSSQKDDYRRGQKTSRSKSRGSSIRKKSVTINDDRMARNLLEADEIDPTEHKVIQTDDLADGRQTPASTRWLEPDELTVRTSLVLDVYTPERPRPPEKDKKTQTDRDQRTQTQRDKRTQTQRDKRTQTLKDNVTQTPRESWTQGPVDCLKPPPLVDKITQYPGLTPGQPCIIDAASSALSITGEEYCPVFENRERVRFKEPTTSLLTTKCECGIEDAPPLCRCDEFYKIPPVKPLGQRSERARDSGTQTVCECQPGKPTSSGDEKKITPPPRTIPSPDKLLVCKCGSPKDKITGDQNKSSTAPLCMCGLSSGTSPGDQKKVSIKPVPSYRNAVPLCKCGPSAGNLADQKKVSGVKSKETMTICKCGPSSGDLKKSSPPQAGILCRCTFETPTYSADDQKKVITIPPYRNAVPLCKCRPIPGSPPGDQKKTQDTVSFCKCGTSHPGNPKKASTKPDPPNKAVKETLPLCKCGISSGDGRKYTTKPVQSKDRSSPQDVKEKKSLLDRWWPFNRSSKIVICNSGACQSLRTGRKLKPADNPEVGNVEKSNKRETVGPFNNSRTLMVTSKADKSKCCDKQVWVNKPCVPGSETDSKDSLASGYKMATAPSSAVKVCCQNPQKNRVVHEQVIPRQCSKCKNTYIQSVGVRKTPSRCSPM